MDNQSRKTVFELSGEFPFSLPSIPGEKNNKPIYIGSPFSGYPVLKMGSVRAVQHSLLVDSNIFGDIWKKRNSLNIAKLLSLASRQNIKISITYALLETYLRYEEPDNATKEFIQSLQEDYGIIYPPQDIEALMLIVKTNLNSFRLQIDLIKNYLIIVKNIFLTPGTVEQHVKTLAELIRYNNLPQFGFILILSLVLFFARKNQSLFDKKMIDKINKDMQIRPTRQKENELLDNVSRDLCLYLSCADSFYHFLDEVNEICWLASGDATIGLMLGEINITGLVFTELCCQTKETVHLSQIDLKKSGQSYSILKPLIHKYWGENLNYMHLDSTDINTKMLNLEYFACSIMNRYEWKEEDCD